MPLVRIALRAGKSLEYRKSIADAVHHALMKEINVPEKDRFQIITEHDADSLIYEPDYLDIHRTDDVLFIQITISQGRSVELRKNLFRTIAESLALNPGIRPEDVFINLIEVAKENWSFGNGIAQYAM